MRRKLKSCNVTVAIAAIVLCISIQLPFAWAASGPAAKIISVDHPQLVVPGTQFQVTITVDYSDKFLADIGIWDAGKGLMVQSLTLISQFTGPGIASFTLSLVAPNTVGQWHLVAMNRVWWQNAWYQDPSGGAVPFTVAVSEYVPLVLTSQGANTDIEVDNSSFPIQVNSILSLTLPPGEHVLKAPMILQGNLGERYVFDGWSDGVNSDPRQILLTQPMAIGAIYQTEYYLTAQSEMGQVVGEGWYQQGSQATVAVTPTVEVPEPFGLIDEYGFAGWTGASNSTSNIVSLFMDGPKQVNVTWRDVGVTVGPPILVDFLLLGCLLLATRLVLVHLRHRTATSGSATKAASLRCIILVLPLLIVPTVLPVAHAQLPAQPMASIVTIGDAQWYYWNQPGSDTCLIWLGGGIPGAAEPGSYEYWINPFDYESFGTIRFIQGLAGYYCVIALENGSSQSFNPAANRTINQEAFGPQSTTIEGLHTWITEHGYQHTFLVGYSVGGQVAAAEVTLSHPGDWSTQDGVVLITVPFGDDVLRNVNELRTNLFLIYGGNLPDYEATGLQYFNGAPAEGLHGTQFFHKEFHVIEDVGHEVWTVRSTGEYDTRALNLVVGFIEKSKALQVKNLLEPRADGSSANVSAAINSIQAPESVATGSAFMVTCNVVFNSLSDQPRILVAYDAFRHTVLSVTNLTASSTSTTRLVVPPISNSSELSLSIYVLQNSNGLWEQVSPEYTAIVTVAGSVTFTLETFVPGLAFSFDGVQYVTNASGLAQIETSQGQHVISLPRFVYVSNSSRLRFTGWEDSPSATYRQLNLEGDSILVASYSQQYFIQVNSQYGQPSGSGWYDAGSFAAVQVQPPMLNESQLLFLHWTHGINESQVRTLVLVGSPMAVTAVWGSSRYPLGSLFQDPWMLISALSFIFLLILNWKVRVTRKGRDG